jgi:hypothetical protein
VVLDETSPSEAVDDRPAARARGLPPLRSRAEKVWAIDSKRVSEFGNREERKRERIAGDVAFVLTVTAMKSVAPCVLLQKARVHALF